MEEAALDVVEGSVVDDVEAEEAVEEVAEEGSMSAEETTSASGPTFTVRVLVAVFPALSVAT